jgi:allantoin racemase
MTDHAATSAGKVFRKPWEFRAVHPPGGPESIESWFETSVATMAIMTLVKENPDIDGIVLACYGDPGLFALREIVDVPVVGIAEASFLTACMIAYKFGILVGEHKDVPSLENVLWTYGLEKRCAGLEPIGTAILDLQTDPAATLLALENSSKKLITQGAETVLLGCAGLSNFKDDLSRSLEVPVIDPIEAACWQLRGLVEMGLSTSRAGMFAKPNPKELTHLDRIFEDNLSTWLKIKSRSGFGDEDLK